MSKRAARRPAAEGFQVGPATVVRVRYGVYDADGEPVGSAESEHELVFGFGQLLPRLERALEGARVGDTREVLLSPHDAYGPRDPDCIIEVDRADFPPDVAVGDDLELENAQGSLLVVRVLEVLDDAVVLDMNHPLAGQKVRFSLQVVDVRPATEEELSRAAEALEQEPGPAAPPLIAPGRLLEGRGRRYDSPPSPTNDSSGEEPV